MPKPETPPGKYLYCIMRSPAPREFTTLGVGERGDPVHTVHFRELAAAVSDSPVVEYESSRRNMMAHTRVLEEALREFTILPVRFGTVVPTPSAELIEKLLQRRYGEFTGLLGEMEGRVELGLKAFWYEQAIFREIVEENPPVRQLRDSLMARPAEETYYERIRLGEMIESAMWKKRDEDAERILSHLRPLVHKTRANKVVTDRMVLNAAFLVEAARQAEFDARVKKLDEELGKRLIFKYVGPVPPYNFVNIVVTWEDERIAGGVQPPT
ncbi:MAG: GvpL/GvpF family gas vesicle protein [Chloroflexi bacterium]|nr:GvpL/GvpF family gas vesicle protein [Chloroflexota bacterium]